MKFTKMTTIWATLSLIILIISCFLPVQLWYKHYTLISIMGSFLFMVFIVVAYNQLFPLEEIDYQKEDYEATEKRNGDARIARLVIGILALIISVALIIIINNKREDYAFENEGIITKATISDGGETITTITKKRLLGLVDDKSKSNSYTITVDYKLEDGEEMSVEQSITAEQYNEAYLNKDIEIIYYKKVPRMIKVLLGF